MPDFAIHEWLVKSPSVGKKIQLLVERDQVWRLLVTNVAQSVVSSPLW